MRGFFAGCSFALLVGLAVFTAAIRAENVRVRRALEGVTRDVHARRVELAKRQFEVRMAVRHDALARCWRRVLREALAE